MTALAAVIALSSSPLLAQSVDPAASDSAPVVIAPPTPAPEVAAPAATPPATMAPVVHQPIAPTSTQNVTATANDQARPRTTHRVAAAPPARAAIAPVPVATAAIAPVPVATTPAPVATAPMPVATPPATQPVATVTAVRKESAATTIKPAPVPASGDEMIELLAVAGLGVLALGGGAFALARRRRRDEDVAFDETIIATAPIAPPEFAPAFFAGLPGAAALPPDRPLTTMPENFDASRFGPHVQAAYRGPTADNPSLSLKTRLKRARFFDQRDRMTGTHASAEEMAAHARAAREAHEQERSAFWPHDPAEGERRPAFQS